MTTTSVERKGVVYPMVTVDVNGVKCRALLDTGAGSSYASSTLLNCLHLRPIRQQFKRIEMMFGTSNKAIDVYGLQIRSVDGKFILEAEVNKVDRKELLTLEKFLTKRSCARMQNLQRRALFMMLLQELMQMSPHSTSASKSALHYYLESAGTK